MERRNLPAGDNDLILNLDDFTPLASGVGDEGRRDFRNEDGGGEAVVVGGETGRMAGVFRIVGTASVLIDPRIVYRPPPPRPRGARARRSRWKLLAEASESLS